MTRSEGLSLYKVGSSFASAYGAAKGASIGQHIGATVANSVGGTLGQGVGSVFGPLGAVLGGFVGATFFDKLIALLPFFSLDLVQGPRLTDEAQLPPYSEYGGFIPQVYGKIRVPGTLIYCSGLTEYSYEFSDSVRYYYKATFVFAICEGEINQVTGAWNGKNRYSIVGDNIETKLGSEAQTHSELLFNHVASRATIDERQKSHPDYKGLAYIVYVDHTLDSKDNYRIPQLVFDVVRKVSDSPGYSQGLTAIEIMPGYGAGFYDTNQNYFRKNYYKPYGKRFPLNPVGRGGYFAVTAFLNGLFVNFPNLEWVSIEYIAVNKGRDSFGYIRGAATNRLPFSTDGTIFRSTDINIEYSHRSECLPYGTIELGMLSGFMKLCAARGLKVMVVPIICFEGTIPTPYLSKFDWIKGSGTSGKALYFSRAKKWVESDLTGFYKQVVSSLTDFGAPLSAICLGAGLDALLTSYRLSDGTYPIIQLVATLIESVRASSPSDINIVYVMECENYSGYYDSSNNYIFDDIWNAADVVGINLYFSIGSLNNIPYRIPSISALEAGWESGLYWDYTPGFKGGGVLPYAFASYRSVFDCNIGFVPLVPSGGQSPRAFKNITKWFQDEHIREDGTNTGWVKKPIWVVSFGFPFSKFPEYSPRMFRGYQDENNDLVVTSATLNRNEQEQSIVIAGAISATLNYWARKRAEPGNNPLMQVMFLKGWDIREYPDYVTDLKGSTSLGTNRRFSYTTKMSAQPSLPSISYVGWSPSPNPDESSGQYNLRRGLAESISFDGPFSVVTTLAGVLSDICDKASIDNTDFSSLSSVVIKGFVIDNREPAINIVQRLAGVMFFDIVERGGKLSGVNLSTYRDEFIIPISKDKLITLQDSYFGQGFLQYRRGDGVPSRVDVSYVDDMAYRVASQYASRNTSMPPMIAAVGANVVMGADEAKSRAESRLYQIWTQRYSYEFMLMPYYLEVQPGSIVSIVENPEDPIQDRVTHIIRVTESRMTRYGVQNIRGFSDRLPRIGA